MDNKNYYLAIDQGGGSTRAIVFDTSSKLIVKASQSIGVEHPRLGWVEQDANNILASVNHVLTEIGTRLGVNVKHIVAAGLATQRSNVVCWRKTDGKPLSPAISWQDRRAYQWMDSFASHRDKVRQKTGLVVSPHYGVSKIKWCLDNINEVKEARNDNNLMCGPLASFITYNLTVNRRSLVDPANASRTLLWNIHSGDWDAQLLELFELDSTYLPESTHTFSEFGEIDLSGYQVPLVVVTGDQSAALYANGNPENGTVYINMGTGVFIQYPTGEQIVDIPGLLCSTVYQSESKNEYVIESTINGASNALMELEDALGISGDEAEENLSRWFEEYPDPPLFLNGVAGLGAPYWIPDFASKFIGSGTPKEKILAVAESIIFLIKVNIRLLEKSNQLISKIKLTGGLSNSDCLCQKLANLLELPVERSEQLEATAMGLAYLTANSPVNWQASDESETFVAVEDSPLHRRFVEWEKQMGLSLQKYNHR